MTFLPELVVVRSAQTLPLFAFELNVADVLPIVVNKLSFRVINSMRDYLIGIESALCDDFHVFLHNNINLLVFRFYHKVNYLLCFNWF